VPASRDRNSAAPMTEPARPAAKNVAQIVKLEQEQIHARTLSERVAAAVTRAAGTAVFAIGHLVWFAAWIAVNSGWFKRVRPFDPFPFSLLTLVVSLEAIFLSIWILIAQNEMTRQADRRAHLDLQVNLLTEQESTATLRILQQVAAHLGLPIDAATDGSLAEETDLQHLVSTMDEALPDSPSGPPMPLRT
jgi:uncharacterized membrane protein